MKPPRLKPRIWRVAGFFFSAFAAIIVPVAGIFLLGFLGPAPYLLQRDKLTTEVFGRVLSVEGATVLVNRCESPDEAGRTAQEMEDRIPIQSLDKTLTVLRYIREDNGKHGLLLPIEEIVLQVEGNDRGQIDRAIGALPFVLENPQRNPIYVLFTEYLGAFFWGLGIYVVLMALAMARGAAWAAEIDPPAGTVPISAEDLQTLLLDLNNLDTPIAVKQKRRGYLIAEWKLADAQWTGLFEKAGLSIAHSLRMRLDWENRIVRAIDISRRIRWSAGVPKPAFSFSFFRGIVFYQVETGVQYGLLHKEGRWVFDRAYQYKFNINEIKRPIVEAILQSGWTFRPVVTFVRFIGG
jgi:hypothetical protein